MFICLVLVCVVCVCLSCFLFVLWFGVGFVDACFGLVLAWLFSLIFAVIVVVDCLWFMFGYGGLGLFCCCFALSLIYWLDLLFACLCVCLGSVLLNNSVVCLYVAYIVVMFIVLLFCLCLVILYALVVGWVFVVLFLCFTVCCSLWLFGVLLYLVDWYLVLWYFVCFIGLLYWCFDLITCCVCCLLPFTPCFVGLLVALCLLLGCGCLGLIVLFLTCLLFWCVIGVDSGYLRLCDCLFCVIVVFWVYCCWF